MGAMTALSGEEGDVLEAVSCTAPGSCTAVGYDDEGGKCLPGPIYAVQTGGAFGPVKALPCPLEGIQGVKSVSCTDASDCTAALDGPEAYAVESKGTWGAILEVQGSGGLESDSISCSDAVDCTDVGGSTEHQSRAMPQRPMESGVNLWRSP